MTHASRRLLLATIFAAAGALAMLPGLHAQRAAPPSAPDTATAARLDARLAQAREQLRNRFVQTPGQIVVDEIALKRHPASDFVIPGDARLLRRSDGVALVEFHDRQNVRARNDQTPANAITYVNLRDGTYRTFELQGAMPNAAEQQRIRDHITADGFQVARLQPLNAPATASASARGRPRLPTTATRFSLLTTLLGRATRAAYPTLSAQASGCYGYWYTTNGVVDPLGITLAQIYPSLSWGVDDFWGDWYGGGDVGYYAANPSAAGTHWYPNSFAFEDDNSYGGPAWGSAWMDTSMVFYNTDFLLNPPPVPVYVYLYEYLGYDSGWIDPVPSYYAWGAWTYILLSNYPTGWFGNGFDGCYYGF